MIQQEKEKKNQQKTIDNNNIICVYASTLWKCCVWILEDRYSRDSANQTQIMFFLAMFCLFCFVFFAEYKCYKLVKTKWCMKKTILVDVNLLFSENVFVITH